VADTIDVIGITEALKSNVEALVEEKNLIRKRDREIDLQLSALHQSLSGLLLYAEALDQNDPRLEALVKSIGELLFPTNSSGTLTEACRHALRQGTGRRKHMSAMDVRKAVEASGFDFSGYTSNPLSSIHTTLRRLKENDEVKEIIVDGTKLYRWIHKPIPATPEEAQGVLQRMSTLNIGFTEQQRTAHAAFEAAMKPNSALVEALRRISVTDTMISSPKKTLAETVAEQFMKDKK